MLRRLALGVALLLAVADAAPEAATAEQSYEQLDPNAYQSFVANWEPDVGPLCAVIRTQADWDRVLKPAPTMGRTKPFSPPPEFWKFKAILLVAHVIGAGDTSSVFQVQHLVRGKGGMQLDYRFTPTPPASSSIKWYLAVAVPKPLPKLVRFTENRRLICTLNTRDMIPVTPPPQ